MSLFPVCTVLIYQTADAFVVSLMAAATYAKAQARGEIVDEPAKGRSEAV